MPVPDRPPEDSRRTRSALWLPIFDELADPALVASLAADAEEAGWDAVFVWDHIRWREPIRAVADPWITMTAIATATERLRFGPMVTPLARRRPTKLARETATLDQLSGGRLILGVGLGGDRFGHEFSKTGEPTDDRQRAAMLDETLAILHQAWTGEPVNHHGEHYLVDNIQFLPRPIQPHIPVWVATMFGNTKPLRRAARHDGFFPVNLEHPDQLAELIERVSAQRVEDGDDLTRPYDVATSLPPDADPQPYADAGATWLLIEFDPGAVSADHVRSVAQHGPPTTTLDNAPGDHVDRRTARRSQIPVAGPASAGASTVRHDEAWIQAIFDRYHQAWSAKDPDAIVALHSEDSSFALRAGEPRTTGRDALRAHFASVFEDFPDYQSDIRRLILGPTHWVLEWTMAVDLLDTEAQPFTAHIDLLDVVDVNAAGEVTRKDVYVDGTQQLQAYRRAGRV